MDNRIDREYYTIRKPELLKAFDAESQCWRPVMAIQYGADCVEILLREAREEFEALLPHIPYIGGDENHLTASLKAIPNAIIVSREAGR
jgi:hypothetical protein